MIVVSDSGPIIHLSMAGRFDLLHALFGEVQIPAMVCEEVAEMGEGLPGAAELKAAGWIKISYVDSIHPALRMADELDAGEREAIALALEVKANHLLADDLPARRVARLLSIPVIGTLGILVAEKRRGPVPRIAPIIATMQAGGCWLSESLVTQVLESVGE